MSRKAERAEQARGQRYHVYSRGEEDLPDYRELHSGTSCPACKGTCEDRRGQPCERCGGEGEI